MGFDQPLQSRSSDGARAPLGLHLAVTVCLNMCFDTVSKVRPIRTPILRTPMPSECHFCIRASTLCDTCTTSPSRQGQHVPTTWGNELGKLRFQSYRWDRRACVHAGLITHKTYMLDSRWKIKSERRHGHVLSPPPAPLLTMLIVGKVLAHIAAL